MEPPQTTTLNRIDGPGRHVLFYDRWDGSGPVHFLGQPDPLARSPDTVAESDLVQIAVRNAAIRGALLEALDQLPPGWMLVNELRGRVFPDQPDGKPGDFDIIVGELDDGRP